MNEQQNAGAPQQQAPQKPAFDLSTSRGFTEWLATQHVSLAFSTYQIGSVFFIGLTPNGQLSIYERSFNRAMGFWCDGQRAWLAVRLGLWRLENALAEGAEDDGYDRLYVPREGRTTGDLDVHDLAEDADGRLLFVNTRFNCLSTVHPRHSFEPVWVPPFITKMAPEDRCHLNGLAMEDGRARYATVCARSDVADGWRDFRMGGGTVFDIPTKEIVATELSMSHSPRMYRGTLWVLDSGTGHFGRIDVEKGTFEPITFVPGYARGLAFCGDYAIVGTSKCRRERTFQGLGLDKNLGDKMAEARCGLQIIELATGAVVHWVRIEGVIHELYDVVTLPGVRRPKAMSFLTNETANQFWAEHDGTLEHWTIAAERPPQPPQQPGNSGT